MRLLYGLLSAVSCLPAVLVLTSTETPAVLLPLLQPPAQGQWLPAGVRYTLQDVNSLDTLETNAQGTVAVVDATFQGGGSEEVQGLCGELGIPHIVVGYAAEKEASPWSFFLSPTSAQLSLALQSTSHYFNWTHMTLATDNSPLSQSLSPSLISSANTTYDRIRFSLFDDESIERVVGRSMRNMGNRVTVFLTQAEVTRKVESAQKQKAIAGAGFANVMFLNSVLDYEGGEGLGDLVLVEEGFEQVKTSDQFYRKILESVGILVANCGDAMAVLQRLQLQYPTHYIVPRFSLINLQSRGRKSIGQVFNSSVALNDTVYFLGNSTSVPKSQQSPLQISGNFGIRNANSIAPLAQNYYRGAVLAVSQINERRDVLANFALELFNFTAGVQQWDYSFAYQNVYPNRDKLGLALLTSASSGLTIQLCKFLNDINYTGAVLGASNTVDALSSKVNFPPFLRTISPDKFIAYVYLQMFKHFGWKNCALFVSNETWGLSFHSGFTSIAAANDISILNSPEFQVLPTPIPTLDTLRNYTENFIDFINCKAKILIISVNNNAFLIIDYLYELGIRGGEIQIVANEWLSISFIATNDTEVSRKRSELLRGAIQFSPLGFVGDFGRKVQSDYAQQYAVTPPLYACFYYDAVLTIAYALDTVIALGDDYLDRKVVQKALRAQKFKGCTGTVVFESETNDRAIMQYNILSAQFGQNSSLIESISPVGTFDPTSAVLFRFTSAVIWCDGTTTVPPDLRKSSIGCPFEDKYNLEFSPGQHLVYELSAIFAVSVIAFTVIVWRVWWPHGVDRLREKQEMQPLDTVVFLGIAVDLLQWLSLGPRLTFLPQMASQVIEAAALDASLSLDYKNGGYGTVWLSVFIVFVVWMVMSTLIICHLDRVWQRCPGMHQVGEVSEVLLPLISEYFFIPLLYVMSSTFVCVRSVENSTYRDSYLDSDCYLSCWRGKHLLMVIGAAVSIIVFTPVCIFARPLWQELQLYINIKAPGDHYMTKSILQVIAVLLAITIRKDYPQYHSIAFTVLILLYFVYSVRSRLFNYQKASYWFRVSLCAVLWSSLVATFSKFLSVQSYVWIGLAVAGWVLLVVLALLYARYNIESLLYTREGVEMEWLFRFAFKPISQSVVEGLRTSFEKAGHRNTVSFDIGAARIDESGQFGGATRPDIMVAGDKPDRAESFEVQP